MITYNHIYESKEILLAFIDNVNIDESANVLIRVYSAIHNMKEVNELISTMHKKIKNAQIIGCSKTY